MLVRQQAEDLQATLRMNAQRFATSDMPIAPAMNATMLAAFCLELWLKVFYLTYYRDGIKGHHLLTLYEGLPPPIQHDISDCYLQVTKDRGGPPIVISIGLRTSPMQPDVPEQGPIYTYDTAQDLLSTMSDLFVRYRYFAEEIGGIEWSLFPLPLKPALHLGEAMQAVLTYYERRGGWHV
jgi:hypothetical protein